MPETCFVLNRADLTAHCSAVFRPSVETILVTYSLSDAVNHAVAKYKLSFDESAELYNDRCLCIADMTLTIEEVLLQVS